MVRGLVLAATVSRDKGARQPMAICVRDLTKVVAESAR
jgi:hypothetical protein